MDYDFRTLPARRGTGSSKWNAMLGNDPSVAEDVVPLSVADMEFLTPAPIRDALHRLIDSTSLGYTDPTGPFYDAVISWQARRHGWTPQREWIALSPGVVPALHTAVNALTEPGDGVIIQPPVYYPFTMAVERTGRTVVRNPLIMNDGTYTMDFEGLERLAGEKSCKAIIVCSPHNPVGRVWTEIELKRLLAICCGAGVSIICDEIHNDLIMPGYTHRTLLSLATPEQARHIMVCTSCSKTFNLAGTQGSVIFIPGEELRKSYESAFSAQGMFQLNAFAYAALIAAYNRCEGWLDKLIGVLEANYRMLRDHLEGKLGGLHVAALEGTYLPWVDFSVWGMDSKRRERFLQTEAQLYLDSGRMFGEEGEAFERFNIACPAHVLEAALGRLEAAYASPAFEAAKIGEGQE